MYATALVCMQQFFSNRFNKCIMMSMNEIDSMIFHDCFLSLQRHEQLSNPEFDSTRFSLSLNSLQRAPFRPASTRRSPSSLNSSPHRAALWPPSSLNSLLLSRSARWLTPVAIRPLPFLPSLPGRVAFYLLVLLSRALQAPPSTTTTSSRKLLLIRHLLKLPRAL